MGALAHELFGYSSSILFRNALVAQVGLRRWAVLPHDARCWNRPRLSWSTSSLMFCSPLSTIVVVIAMTAARWERPRAFTACTTIRAQDTR
ncbi:hypothetical protein C5N14_30660 [Micromonospora sp. MW-13]|nr:hypothetical protein C5N14_30660 [Micromonospora sp. MW-13]